MDPPIEGDAWFRSGPCRLRHGSREEPVWRRRNLPTACDLCRKRRIRCTSFDKGAPCDSCVKRDSPCVIASETFDPSEIPQVIYLPILPPPPPQPPTPDETSTGHTTAFDFERFLKRLKESGTRPAPLAWKSVEDDRAQPGPRTRGGVKRSLRDTSSESCSRSRGESDYFEGEEEGESFISISRAKRVRLPPPRDVVREADDEPQEPPPMFVIQESKSSVRSSLNLYTGGTRIFKALDQSPLATGARFQRSSAREEPFVIPSPTTSPITSVGSSSLARLLNPVAVAASNNHPVHSSPNTHFFFDPNPRTCSSHSRNSSIESGSSSSTYFSDAGTSSTSASVAGWGPRWVRRE